MNEISARWRENREWSLLFSERDRLVVDSLVRDASERDVAILPLDEDDDDLLFALLHLSHSVELDHVALSLDQSTLASYLADVDGRETSDEQALLVARRVISAFGSAASRLARATVARDELGEFVGADGLAVLVSYRDERPAFAYLRRLAFAEGRLARALVQSRDDISHARETLIAITDIAHDEDDVQARNVATRALTHRVSIVTGGPGTGKTTTVTRFLASIADVLRARRALTASTTPEPTPSPLVVALCAPTAKAALRLRDAMNQSLASRGLSPSDVEDVLRIHERSGSVHRLLGLRPDLAVAFDHVDADFVVCDESSMLELPLLDQLISRVRPDAHIVVVGDPNQLASVNVGAALRDAVESASPAGPLARLVTNLQINFRSSDAIQRVAEAIQSGDPNHVHDAIASVSPVVTVETNRNRALEVATAWAKQLVEIIEDPQVALATLETHVVLCATREGPGSVAWWNGALEPVVRRSWSAPSRFAPGTPVVITKNERTVDDPLSNGDVGVIAADGRGAFFGPAARPRYRPVEDIPDCEAAWAMTIHKSQGSEFENVTVSLPERPVALLTRELLYTAVTRARHSVALISSRGVLDHALARRVARVSGLGERLASLTALDPADEFR